MGKSRQPVITYKALFWVAFIAAAFLFILDRMTINVLPREKFSTPGFGTSSDKPWSQNVSVTWSIHEAISRVSGRYTMIGLNALFFTTMHTLHAKLSTSFLGDVIDFTDETAQLDIHRKIGASVCIITVVHVWTILLPCIFQGFTVGILVGTFSWPLSEREPAIFGKDRELRKHIDMEVDDVYRLVLMTVLLGPILYCSVKWIATNYRFGIRLHQFVMFMYFIDIVRRHTHPHTWILNVPMFVLWVMDNIAGFWYHYQSADVEKVILSPNSMLLLWKSARKSGQNKESQESIGSIAWMNGAGRSGQRRTMCTMEPRHPFTTFTRRTLQLKSVSSNEWDHATIVRSYNEKLSYTKKLRKPGPTFVHVWGPFSARAVPDLFSHGCNVLLIGGGSGSGYLIDTLIYLSCQITNTADLGSVRLVFTSRELGVIQFWIDVIDDVMQQNPLLANVARVKIFFTSAGEAEQKAVQARGSWGSLHFQRCDFHEEAAAIQQICRNGQKAHVFCHGAGTLQKAARAACGKHGLVYHETHVYDDTPQRAADPVADEEIEVVDATSSTELAPASRVQVAQPTKRAPAKFWQKHKWFWPLGSAKIEHGVSKNGKNETAIEAWS